MNNQSEIKLRRRIRKWIIFFIVVLVLSGLTAFPIETELKWLIENHYSSLPIFLREWFGKVYTAVLYTNQHYPFLAYGTDWLAFAHIVIAVLFIGPLKDPVRNIWCIQWGMIACVMVIPLALIAGHIRHIPFWWQLIDCSFGIFGFITLYFCYKDIRRLEKMEV